MRRVRPHIVHASSSKAGVLGRVAAWLAGVPIRVFTVHGWAFGAYTGIDSRLYRLAERAVRPLTTVTICVSETERAAGLDARTCDAPRTVVIHTGIDVSARPLARPAMGMPVIVSVGRFQAPKDAMTLLRALALLRGPYRALLVGDGPDLPAAEEERRRLGLDDPVVFAGERNDIPAILASSHVFVLSSRSEALPVSILEAMAAGLPVVATRVGGVPEIVVDGETGLLVSAADPPALAAALQRLVDDPELRARLGFAGRQRAEERFRLDSFLRGASRPLPPSARSQAASSSVAVAQAAIQAAHRQRGVVAPGQLRPKVEEAVTAVDLPASEGETVRRREVHARLARHRDVVSRCFDELLLPLAEEARRVRESRDATCRDVVRARSSTARSRSGLVRRRARAGSGG